MFNITLKDIAAYRNRYRSSNAESRNAERRINDYLECFADPIEAAAMRAFIENGTKPETAIASELNKRSEPYGIYYFAKCARRVRNELKRIRDNENRSEREVLKKKLYKAMN